MWWNCCWKGILSEVVSVQIIFGSAYMWWGCFFCLVNEVFLSFESAPYIGQRSDLLWMCHQVQVWRALKIHCILVLVSSHYIFFSLFAIHFLLLQPQVLLSSNLNMYRKFTLYFTVTNHSSSNLYHVKIVYDSKLYQWLCHIIVE